MSKAVIKFLKEQRIELQAERRLALVSEKYNRVLDKDIVINFINKHLNKLERTKNGKRR